MCYDVRAVPCTSGAESASLPTLAAYYRGGLRLEAAPGTRFTYGNHGFATLGQIVEDVSGKRITIDAIHP